MGTLLGKYLLALVLTVVIEGSIAYLLGLREKQAMLAFALINVITNVTLNYLLLVLGYLGIATSLLLVIALEIVVVIVEWRLLIYALREPKRRFLTLAILGNTASFLAGVLLFW
ncbi:MAG: hypothetical protein JXA21_17250 [Anaerolineae bacterium]|nr:hypothetical protein [Anaerolineae bacterium]